jgi:DnaJ-class molecular chaperone
MAPEALSGTFDFHSDLYSLGCVLFEAVTGRRPFTGTSWQLINQHLKEPPAPLRTLRPDAPVELERLVSQLLAKEPARRPDSADEVYDLLEEISDRYFGDTQPIGDPPPSRGSDVTSEVCLHPDEATSGAVIPLRMTSHESCHDCAPRGDETRVLACPTCKGEGRIVRDQRTYKVRIPAGVKNGQKIRVRELGAPGKHGGAPGDLYVTVHVIS